MSAATVISTPDQQKKDEFTLVDPQDPRFVRENGLVVYNRKYCLAKSYLSDGEFAITAHAFDRFIERVDRSTQSLFPALDLRDKQDTLWAMHVLLSGAEWRNVEKQTHSRGQEVLYYQGWNFIVRRNSETRIVTCYKENGHRR